MEIGTRQAGRSPQGHRHTVFIGTIGELRVTTRAVIDPWVGGGIGRRQLKLMWSYLVAHVGRPVDREDLAAIANPKWRSLIKPQNLPAGLLNMLQRWGIRTAIHKGERTITLRRHASWISDVDLIQRYSSIALDLQRAGNQAGALELFRRAAKYCGGIYLPGFVVENYDLTAAQQHWEHYQRDVLHRFIRLCLAVHRLAWAQAAAEKLTTLGDLTHDDCLLLAEVYAAVGHPQLAEYYRQLVDEIL
jgi:hypothetical protein